jgi:DNA-binding response OmpR family regulator
MKLLIVEDDDRIASIVQRALVEESYAVDRASNGQEALNAFAINSYDGVILDLLLPGIAGGGFGVCMQIRRMNKDVPILMLTALDSPQDKVKGLDLGADDYLVKPFHIEELLARVRALLRRIPQAMAIELSVGDLRLDTVSKNAYRRDVKIKLSAKEYAVLEYLLRHAGRVINQTELIEHAWDSNYDGMSNVVETYIRYLRKKLSPNGEPRLIKTKRGLGYVIEEE